MIGAVRHTLCVASKPNVIIYAYPLFLFLSFSRESRWWAILLPPCFWAITHLSIGRMVRVWIC